jgi:hypothetical protein
MTKSEELKLEYGIKRLPTNKKISELTKEVNQMTIAKDLKAITREIKALEKTISKLAKTVGKNKKSKAAKKSTGKIIKVKNSKRAPAKRKTTKLTATDQVLKILKGRKRGVNVATLMEKTGFDNKKIQNILQRTYKQGKIKRVGKGMYVGS